MDVNEIFISLEPLLSRVDNLRWLSLLALYPLFPKLSSKQRNLALLTQTDIGHLIQSLQNPHSIHSTVKLMSHAVSFIHNVKVLFENGIAEFLAELLEDQNICQEDMNIIVMLIEKIATTDVNGVDLQKQCSEIEDKVATASETAFFIQQLRGIFDVNMTALLQPCNTVVVTKVTTCIRDQKCNVCTTLNAITVSILSL